MGTPEYVIRDEAHEALEKLTQIAAVLKAIQDSLKDIESTIKK